MPYGVPGSMGCTGVLNNRKLVFKNTQIPGRTADIDVHYHRCFSTHPPIDPLGNRYNPAITGKYL